MIIRDPSVARACSKQNVVPACHDHPPRDGRKEHIAVAEGLPDSPRDCAYRGMHAGVRAVGDSCRRRSIAPRGVGRVLVEIEVHGGQAFLRAQRS